MSRIMVKEIIVYRHNHSTSSRKKNVFKCYLLLRLVYKTVVTKQSFGLPLKHKYCVWCPKQLQIKLKACQFASFQCKIKSYRPGAQLLSLATPNFSKDENFFRRNVNI